MSADQDVILPGATLGVLGGGQLGRMFVQEAQAMGYFTAVLDQDATSPAGLVSHHHIRTGYEDAQGLAEMARLCAAVTTEFENVPARALARIADRIRVHPSAGAVAAAQDRLTGALGRLLMVAENYPQLKSNENFLALQSQLEGTENRITVARRDYIQQVQTYNLEFRNIPDKWVAGIFHGDSRPAETFKAAPEAQSAPKVSFQ